MPMLGYASPKQPSEVESYSIYYGNDVLFTETLTLLSVTTECLTDETATPLVVETSVLDDAGQRVRVFISGGQKDNTYKVTVKVASDYGRVLEDEFKIKIKDS